MPINAFASGDEQRMMLLGVKRFTKVDSFNSKDAKRRIADKLIAIINIRFNFFEVKRKFFICLSYKFEAVKFSSDF